MVREGIDVSQYQGQIDWELVKNHIDFCNLTVWLLVKIFLVKDDPSFKKEMLMSE